MHNGPHRSARTFLSQVCKERLKMRARLWGGIARCSRNDTYCTSMELTVEIN